LTTNNNHINNTNTTTNREDAVAVVNFKKLKEKGEEEIEALKTIRLIQKNLSIDTIHN